MSEEYTRNRDENGKIILNRISTDEVDKEDLLEHLQEMNRSDKDNIDRIQLRIDKRKIRITQIINIL